MEFIKQSLYDVWLIQPRIFYDERGYFMESFRYDQFEKHIGQINFIQDNESKSTQGVLRGLHYQIGEYSQAKLVRVLQGAVLDVIVDLRKSSPTFGQHLAIELSEENKMQLFVPRGFAHGFKVISDTAIFAYKVDNIYSKEQEATLLWNDSNLDIHWDINESEIILSEKDKIGKPFSETPLFD